MVDDTVLVTGQRVTAFEPGAPGHEAVVAGAWRPDPLILDDQALVVEVAGRGLVVLLGCGHAGVVNTVAHPLALTHTSRLAPVVGGFHLSTPAAIPLIGPTVDALATYRPELVVAGHCTG